MIRGRRNNSPKSVVDAIAEIETNSRANGVCLITISRQRTYISETQMVDKDGTNGNEFSDQTSKTLTY